jgi:hypothetical protein
MTIWLKFHPPLSTENFLHFNALKCTEEELVKCYIWSIASYGGEIWTVRTVDKKHMEGFEMWCWRRLKISWTEHVRNEEVLYV